MISLVDAVEFRFDNAFLLATHTEVHATIEIAVDVARELTELFRGGEVQWQVDGTIVEFWTGKIHGFLKSPNIGAEHRASWLARIDKALHRAGLAV